MARRGQGEGSIYQRADGRWVGSVTIGYEDGKQKRKSFYGKTRKEVKEKLTTAVADQQRGLPVAFDERLTLGAFLDEWLEHSVKPSVRPSTYKSYSGLVRLHLKPVLGHHRLTKLEPQHVQRFMNRKLKSGLSPRTVDYCRAVLRRALNQALRWGHVPRNVATLVDPPRAKRPEIQPLTPDEAKALLDAVAGDRLEALYAVALAVGLRKGEALGLRWDDVDLEAGTLSVRKQLQRVDGKLQLVDLKTDRSRRTITLPSISVDALRRHRVRQLEERLVAGRRWSDSGLVFTTTIGTPIDARNLSRWFHEHRERAGIRRVRFHDLRHTCATLLLVQGVHPRVVMDILGHSQISLTLDTYSHVIPSLQAEAAEKMDALLSRNG